MLADSKARVVGLRQVIKAAQDAKLKTAYLAGDAEAFIKRKVTAACEAAGVELQIVPSMLELGRLCGIEVGAACAGILI